MHLLLNLALLAQLAAFPGAMGGGTLTQGGRGGQIIEITNTNDSGAGSYRACATANGPRFCVCRTGGVVPIRSDVTVSSPYLTLDLQTCPGGGLILGDGQINGRPLNITTHDVVVRYATFWMNNPNIHSGPDTGTTGIEIGTGASNVVLDHLSCYAAGNKCIISYTSTNSQAAIIHDVTLDWSILGMPNQGHPVGPMTDTCCYAYLSVNQDFHHNYFPWIGHRIALANTNQMHWVNNLTYNWSDPSAQYGFALFPQGPSQNDFIGNIWAIGNMNVGNSANPHPVNINATGSSDCTVSCWNGAIQPSDYMSGNICAQGTDWNCAAQTKSEGGPETGPVPAAWMRNSPLPPEPNPIVPDSTTGLDTKILATVGNSQGLTCDGSWFSRRNAIDLMLVQSYPNGKGQLFTGQFNAPTAAAGTPCDEDPINHLPIVYEAKYLIKPGTPPWTVGKSGYPIIEEYANGTGSTPPPQPPVVTCAPSSVAPGGNSQCNANQQIVNWSASSGAMSSSGMLTAPMSPATVTVTGSNPNGSGQTPVTVATPGMWSGWLGSDALPGAAIGKQVVIGAGAGPVRSAGCGSAPPIQPQPTNYIGSTVTVIGGPASCNGGIQYWQVQSGAVVHPTVTCSPSSITTAQTSQCTADQTVTWSATLGSISAAGLFTPSGAGTAQITGTNANGSGSVPVQVTATPPAQFQLNCVVGANNAITCSGVMP